MSQKEIVITVIPEDEGVRYPLGPQPASQEKFFVLTDNGTRQVTGRVESAEFVPFYPSELTDEQILLGGG